MQCLIWLYFSLASKYYYKELLFTYLTQKWKQTNSCRTGWDISYRVITMTWKHTEPVFFQNNWLWINFLFPLSANTAWNLSSLLFRFSKTKRLQERHHLKACRICRIFMQTSGLHKLSHELDSTSVKLLELFLRNRLWKQTSHPSHQGHSRLFSNLILMARLLELLKRFSC